MFVNFRVFKSSSHLIIIFKFADPETRNFRRSKALAQTSLVLQPGEIVGSFHGYLARRMNLSLQTVEDFPCVNFKMRDTW